MNIPREVLKDRLATSPSTTSWPLSPFLGREHLYFSALLQLCLASGIELEFPKWSISENLESGIADFLHAIATNP